MLCSATTKGGTPCRAFHTANATTCVYHGDQATLRRAGALGGRSKASRTRPLYMAGLGHREDLEAFLNTALVRLAIGELTPEAIDTIKTVHIIFSGLRGVAHDR